MHCTAIVYPGVGGISNGENSRIVYNVMHLFWRALVRCAAPTRTRHHTILIQTNNIVSGTNTTDDGTVCSVYSVASHRTLVRRQKFTGKQISITDTDKPCRHIQEENKKLNKYDLEKHNGNSGKLYGCVVWMRFRRSKANHNHTALLLPRSDIYRQSFSILIMIVYFLHCGNYCAAQRFHLTIFAWHFLLPPTYLFAIIRPLRPREHSSFTMGDILWFNLLMRGNSFLV